MSFAKMSSICADCGHFEHWAGPCGASAKVAGAYYDCGCPTFRPLSDVIRTEAA